MAKSTNAEAAKLAKELITDLTRDNRKATEQRAHTRILTPELHVLIGGVRFHTIDWSMGGMLLKGLGERLKPGDRLQVLLWDGIHDLRHHAVTALVVRYDAEKGGIAFNFVEMSSGTLPWLSDLQRGALGD